MNREKIAWLTSIVVIAMLAFQLPGTFAHREDDYAFVKTLIDLHRQIDNNYVEPVDEDKLKLGAINGMMGELDPYSIYVPPAKQKEFDNLLEGSFEGVGIQLDQLENGDIQVVSPIEDSPALKAGVQPGDIITKVNGQSIQGLKIPDVQTRIKGPLNSEVRLTVKHPNGQEVELTMRRQEIVLPTVKGFKRDPQNRWDYWVSENPKIAYVRITQFTSDTFAKLKEATDKVLPEGMQGLILDLRFNPGGRLDQAKDVVDLFVRQGVIVRTQGLHRAEEITYAKAEGTLPDFPMIVLVNEHSASAAEIVAGSLKDNHRALILGTRTYGKGSVQELIPMEEDGGELKLTVAYYYLPSGRLVHRKKGATDWGVDPNIVVAMDEETEKKVVTQEMEQELFHSLATRPTTGPATTRPGAAPTTQPMDVQLQAAISTMIGHIVLNGEHSLLTALPATQPATQPVTRP